MIQFLAILLFSATAMAFDPPVEKFANCYEARAKKIPNKADREFLDSYLIYLKSGKKADGEATIEKMQTMAKEQGGKFSTNWAGILEGNTELCCGAPQACTESFGSISFQVLRPRISKGEATAINLVLAYEKFAKTDGAETEGLREYLDLIKKKHPDAMKPVATAPTTTEPGPASQNSRFVYLEFHPNSDKKLTIQSTKCNPDTNDLHVQKYQSTKKVVNGVVNALNVYVRSGDCKTSSLSSVWEETIQMPKNGKFTHVYVTILSDNVTVF